MFGRFLSNFVQFKSNKLFTSFSLANVTQSKFTKGKYFLFSIFSASLFAFTRLKKNRRNPLKCCGIIGYLGKEKNAVDACVQGIQILQFRGYDSCGLCTLDSKRNFQITKYASEVSLSNNNNGDCIQKIVESAPKIHESSPIGIAHTRWATHGRKIALNAHPHVDFSGKIALVHNGIVDNYRELHQFLSNNGIKCKSDTDTEVIVQIIGMYYSKGYSFKESVAKTLNEHIIGSYALVIMNKDVPDSLIVARNGSPLLVGTGKDFFIVSSDVSAFQKYTNNYFNVDSSNILELNLNMKISTDKIKTSITEQVLLTPREGYKFFMLQEIYEQPETINRAMNFGSRFKPISNSISAVKLGGLEQYSNFLKNGKNLIIIACGTSYHASLFVSNLMRKFNVFNSVQIIDGAEFNADYIPQDNPIAIFVSQSGETFDILKPLEICKNKGLICIGIVNKVESTLARSVLCGVFVNAGREISVASTKAFTGQVIALLLSTLFFAQIKLETSFINPLFISTVKFIKDSSSLLEECLPKFDIESQQIAKALCNFSSIFVIGKGFGEAIAKEIALKIKEVSYLHCEAYNAGAFKHGPIAMIDSNKRTPVIVIVSNDDYFDDMLTSFNQIKSRNATTILLTNCKQKLEIDDSTLDYIVEYPDVGIMSSFFAAFIGQLIAYYTAVEKNYNPDKPRQLSKEITTK